MAHAHTVILKRYTYHKSRKTEMNKLKNLYNKMGRMALTHVS